MNNKSTLTPDELVKFFLSREKRADLNKAEKEEDTPNGLMQEEIVVEPLEDQESEDALDFLQRIIISQSGKVAEAKETLGEQLADIKEKALANIDTIKNTQLKSQPNPFIGGPLSPMLTEEGVEQEVEKFVDPMLRDPDLLKIPPKLFDESAQQTEEALTDAEIADIATSAIDAAGKEPEEIVIEPLEDKGLMSPADKASTSPMLTEEGVEQEVAKVLGDTLGDLDPMGQGYEAYLERYTTVDNVDFDFIKELEGYKTDMYVPKIDGEVLEESGATIASGFDLGQRNESDLKGLPQSLINKLKPYLGKQKKAADDFVKANPLTITEKEADIINAFVKKQELDRLIEDWNNSSDVKWENLSEPQATTVASVAFQFGNLPTRTPKFWRYTTTGDWAAARDELRDFYGKDKKGLERQEIYGPRRDKEADYLEQDNAAILGTKAY